MKKAILIILLFCSCSSQKKIDRAFQTILYNPEASQALWRRVENTKPLDKLKIGGVDSAQIKSLINPLDSNYRPLNGLDWGFVYTPYTGVLISNNCDSLKQRSEFLERRLKDIGNKRIAIPRPDTVYSTALLEAQTDSTNKYKREASRLTGELASSKSFVLMLFAAIGILIILLILSIKFL